MIVRKVNYTLPDEQGNVNVGTVKTINSERPDQNGDITLDFAPYDDVELLSSALSQHMQTMASKDERGHVFIDNETIVVNANGEISAVAPPATVTVIDNLQSVSPTDALSANQGRELATGIDNVSNLLSRHVQTDKATTSTTGHVMVDGTTITVDATGKISAVAPPNDVEVIDDLYSLSATSALSANQGRLLDEFIKRVLNLLDEHTLRDNGSSAHWGHVRVDGVTILSNQGIIYTAAPKWNEIVDDSTISVNPQGRLSAPLSTEYYHNGNRVNGVKIAMVTAVTTGTEGLWTADYSGLGLQQIFSIQATMQAGNFSAANAPMATNVRSFTLTTATGTAFKATSAGLLTAMQQTRADAGTEIYLQIIGR